MHGDVTVTLSGFVATSPTLFSSSTGTDFTSFRIAQTRRYLDRERGEWVDGRTLWFTVKAFKHVARNVATSLHKGDPVVVTGRLSVDEWTGPDGPRTSLVVEATALGHDLTLGESRFARTVHRREETVGPAGGTDAAAADGADPADGPEDPWRVPAGPGADPDAGPDAGPAGEAPADDAAPVAEERLAAV